MKVATILGTRPEIIRLSRIIPKLDQYCNHVLIHTGQNFDPALSDIFFKDLGIRTPDYYLGVKSDSFGKQIANILAKTEEVFNKEKPDKILVLGDTNSSLCAIVAKRMGIPVYHMEAGNRCYDDRVPEEVNRRIIDHCSDILMPYTERSRANLLKEGIPGDRIFVTGNPIYEVIQYYDELIKSSTVLRDLDILSKNYFLLTMHRAENVDVLPRLKSFVSAIELIKKEFNCPIICSVHPHTKIRMEDSGLSFGDEMIRLMPPFGFFDFIELEQNAKCVISDSGTVQEECCIFKVPNVTIRDVTERPETIESGSNILTGAEPDSILGSVRFVLEQKRNWTIPPEYLVENVSSTVMKIVIGYCQRD